MQVLHLDMQGFRKCFVGFRNFFVGYPTTFFQKFT